MEVNELSDIYIYIFFFFFFLILGSNSDNFLTLGRTRKDGCGKCFHKYSGPGAQLDFNKSATLSPLDGMVITFVWAILALLMPNEQ